MSARKKTMTMGRLNWKPVRNGLIYCAPACGAGCTLAAFIKANQDADALARGLGIRWKPRIWENMGWYFSAVHDSGYLFVDPPPNPAIGAWSAFLGENGASGMGRWIGHGDTPRAAVDDALGQVRRDLMDIKKLIEGVK